MAYEERETGNLIGSDKVEGTAVYGADNQRIGRTHDKRASTIETERAALEKRSQAEDARWEKQKEKLEIALRRARG